jgi:hypothetical protein
VLNLEAGPSAEQIKAQAAHAVSLFLKSYGA